MEKTKMLPSKVTMENSFSCSICFALLNVAFQPSDLVFLLSVFRNSKKYENHWNPSEKSKIFENLLNFTHLFRGENYLNHITFKEITV